jgi:hypothetical protein
MVVIDFIRGATTTETSATEFQPLFSAADFSRCDASVHPVTSG